MLTKDMPFLKNILCYLFTECPRSSKARKAFLPLMLWKKPKPPKADFPVQDAVLYSYSHTKKRGVNLGDYVQTLAVRHALLETRLPKFHDVLWPRDRLSKFTGDKRTLCVMQGWFEQDGIGFLPGQKILPVWIGTHFRRKTQKTLSWLKRFHPDAFDGWEIGCRDLSTLEFCRSIGIDAYFSRCLTLTLPRREKEPLDGKIFSVNCPEEMESLFPEEVKKTFVRINQRERYAGEEKKSPEVLLSEAEDLLNLYRREARLVITTALHCAQPCIAMGIPVVFINPNYDESERFSSFRGLLKIHTMDDLRDSRIDFNCAAPNFESLKRDMLENLRLSILKAQGKHVNESLLREIRNRIKSFQAPNASADAL